MAYSTFSEIQINGSPIAWDYYNTLQGGITPLQGAKLAHRIDPDNTSAVISDKANSIKLLVGYLANRQATYTLPELITALNSYDVGDSDSWLVCREFKKGEDDVKTFNIPQGMIDVVSRQPKSSVGKIPVRPAQIEAIRKTAVGLGYNPLAIPNTGKAAIKKECLKDAKLFTDSGFDHAWKDASKQNVICIQNKEKFLPR